MGGWEEKSAPIQLISRMVEGAKEGCFVDFYSVDPSVFPRPSDKKRVEDLVLVK